MKPKTFKDYCQPGVIISKVKETKPDKTVVYSYHRMVVEANQGSLVVVDQGHHRHLVTKHKFKKYLRQKGIL